MKILILKPSSLGDVVQALPVLRLLKLHYPAGEIYWWISADLLPLLQDDPDLSGLYPFHRRGFTTFAYWANLAQTVRAVREKRFDWVIDLQGLARSALFAWFARGRLTIGVDDPREGARGLYDIVVPRPSFHTHAVDWYLQVLRAVDVPVRSDFVWLPPRERAAAEVTRKWAPEKSRWILLNPGARWENKRWPVEHFCELVRLIARAAPDIRFAILGSAHDRPLGREIAGVEPGRCLDLTGQTSLPEMIEWIRLSTLVVTNDTGPMHVAAALGKPIVGIFGPTEPRRTGPYRQLDHTLQLALPCTPCMKPECTYVRPLECLKAIFPSTVAQRALQLLDHPPKIQPTR